MLGCLRDDRTSLCVFRFLESEKIEVGSLDVFIDRTCLQNSGEEYERKWVESVLNFKIEFLDKYNFNEKSSSDSIQWLSSDQDNSVFALYLVERPEYFLVKTGNNKKNNSGLDYTHFLFKNEIGLDWAVIDLASTFGINYSIQEIGKLSHLSEYSPISTPEPSTFILVGITLLGFGVLALKRKI